MQFKPHFDLGGQHAFLSPSQYHWVNYDEEKLKKRWGTSIAAARGSALHELAHNLVKMKVNLPRSHTTINDFVNDVIGYRMQSEQVLYYSRNCFGTADAISFKRNLLRIFDLKTGVTPAHVEQLIVYAALFCLEYNFKPFEIDLDLRLYQNDEITKWCLDPDLSKGELLLDPADIAHYMDRIVAFDVLIEEMRREEEE